jgi:hypothetical protein
VQWVSATVTVNVLKTLLNVAVSVSPTVAVLRTIASTCMGGAEGNTGTGHTPREAVQPVSEGLGKIVGTW